MKNSLILLIIFISSSCKPENVKINDKDFKKLSGQWEMTKIEQITFENIADSKVKASFPSSLKFKYNSCNPNISGLPLCKIEVTIDGKAPYTVSFNAGISGEKLTVMAFLDDDLLQKTKSEQLLFGSWNLEFIGENKINITQMSKIPYYSMEVERK